ncbi:MAG: hypothetical protein IT430_08080 [Phycisphaerales bacterium]|nr:hypothetical protein [Phycisphaerales bacterium]
MCQNNSLMARTLCAALALATLSPLALAKDATMTFTTPSNRRAATVKVSLDPYRDAQVVIPAGSTVEQKRDLIRDAIKAANPNLTVENVGTTGLKIKDIHDNTTVTFDPGETGEANDKIACAAPPNGAIEFTGFFDPMDWNSQPAVFTAGIVTDVGELTVQVSASELNFQTEGPIICQALFQRLAPQAPQYGANVLFAGDRLEVYFDPAYSIQTGGVIFGSTSQSPGNSGSLSTGRATGYHAQVTGSCPGTVDLHWSGANPGQQQGVVFALNTGSFVVPNGPCQGTQLGLGTSGLQLYATIGTGNGSGTISASVNQSACGGYVQLIALPSCATSNVARVP